MINFPSEEIKKKSPNWSLNEDVKLLNKLKNLDELLSTKTKEILENVDLTNNKVSNETILVKNLINDFYLVGHKQFIENRVEEEDESKVSAGRQYKISDNEETFKQSIEQETLIHEQMKSALENSLKFVNKKISDLNRFEDPKSCRSNELDEAHQVERLIGMSKYHQRKLPPIVNSDEFMNEVFNLVKQANSKSTIKKANSSSNLTESKDEISSISDLENISINEKILAINEHNFIDHLSTSTTRQSSTSYDEVNDMSKKDVSRVDASNLDASQTYKQDKIETISNTNENHSLRRELDAIFGKATNDAKNRLFVEDDSDDELFQPVKSSKSNSKAREDPFKSDSSIDSIPQITSKPKIKSSEKILPVKSSNESVRATNSLPSNKENILDKLFESDSEDEQLFLARPKKQEKLNKQSLIDEKSTSEVKEKIEYEPKSIEKIDSSLRTSPKPEKSVEKNLPVMIANEIEKEDESKIAKSNSSIESLDKMLNKKELFKNQLEDLFSKKRNPMQGLIKAERTVDDLNEDDKLNENEVKVKSIETSGDQLTTSRRLSEVNQRKEFDLFGSAPNDLFASDLSLINTSTLDNNLVKSRIKPNHRKRPTKIRPTISSEQSDALPSKSIQSTKDSTLNDENEKLESTDDKSTSQPSQKLSKSPPKIVEIMPKKKMPFDEISDEDDFFKKSDKKSLNATLDEKFRKLFDSDDDDPFSPFESNTKPKKETEKKLVQPIQSSPPAQSAVKVATTKSSKELESKESPKKPARKTSIFDDDDSDDELFFKK